MNRSRKTRKPSSAVRPDRDESRKQPDRSSIQEYLAEIGRKGGLKGGRARAKSLSAKARKDIATKAARSRWKKKTK